MTTDGKPPSGRGKPSTVRGYAHAPEVADESERTTRWDPEAHALPPPPARGRPTDPTRPPPIPHKPAPPVLPDPAVASAQPRAGSEPIRMVSMKTPAHQKPPKEPAMPGRVIPPVKLRALSEIHNTPPQGMGRLAPPRDPKEARSRKVRDLVIWGSVAVIVASIVMLIVWFAAR